MDLRLFSLCPLQVICWYLLPHLPPHSKMDPVQAFIDMRAFTEEYLVLLQVSSLLLIDYGVAIRLESLELRYTTLQNATQVVFQSMNHFLDSTGNAPELDINIIANVFCPDVPRDHQLGARIQELVQHV